MSALVWKNVGTPPPTKPSSMESKSEITRVDNNRSVIAGTTSIGHMLSAQSSIPQSL